MKPQRPKRPDQSAALIRRPDQSAALLRKPEVLALAQACGMRSIHRRVTAEEVARIRKLAAAKDDTLALLVDLLWTTGARISETLSIKVEDVSFSGAYVTIQTLKKRSGRLVSRGIPLPPMMLGEIAVYINTHRLVHEAHLIHWRRTKAWKELRAVMREAGVEGRAFAHAFRHGHALHACAEGVPLTIIQQTLGHSSLLTTQDYLRATGKDIAHAYSRIAWL